MGALAVAVVKVAKPTGTSIILAHVFTNAEYDEVNEDLGFDDRDEITLNVVASIHATICNFADVLNDEDIDSPSKEPSGSTERASLTSR